MADLTVKEGEVKTITVTVTDSAGDAYSLANVTAIDVTVKRDPNQAAAEELFSSTGAVSDAEAGTFTFAIAAGDLDTHGRFCIGVKLTETANVHKWDGEFEVEETATT